MLIVRQIRARTLRHHIRDQRDFYQRDWLPDGIRQWQLDQFNLQWPVIRRAVPYFKQLSERETLPPKFATWQDFQELMPVMDRRTIQNHRLALTNKTQSPSFWRTTGGSTAEPLRIPAWHSEVNYATKDLWYARSWFDISPADKLFLIWGHSHLLGNGWLGRFNGVARRLKDALLGYYRHSAYDLSQSSLHQAAQALVAFNPDYVVGYAVALDRFARVNRCHQAAFHKLNLKVAIATAESFPSSESAGLIADVLGCPVVMEYGAVETGPMAHQQPDGRFSIFWRHYFLEGGQSAHRPGAYEVFVTSLYPRCFPLVRYRVGDLISANADEGDIGQSFKAVIGRCNDYVILPSGGVVHSEAFSHAVRDGSSILGYQVIQSADGAITLNYVAAEPLALNEAAEIRRRLGQIHPGLATLRIERVESLEQTIAGKTRRIMREVPPLAEIRFQN
jgi:phenylacetate-coenzyme A ligase PaaK-like adenylate-forming protein